MSVRATILPRVLELLQTGPLARNGRRVKVKGPHGIELDCAGPISREIVDAWLNGVVKKSRIPAQADQGMSIEEMKDFVRKHFDDFINRKNSEAALRNFSADFLDHDGATGESIGPEPAKLMIEGLFQQYPDLHVTVEDILGEGDKIMVRNTWRAIEASTGKRIEFRGFVLWRFAHGKIIERWATITPPSEVAQSVRAGDEVEKRD
jgi:predicted ester cyclase